MSDKNLDQPLNTEERYLYAIAVRLDAITEMLASLISAYAQKENLPLTHCAAEEVKPSKKKTKKK